jgi:hypothetical protein
MWSLARCAAELEKELGRAPAALDVQFRQPLFLPGHVTLKFVKNADALDFSLLSSRASQTHLSWSLR